MYKEDFWNKLDYSIKSKIQSVLDDLEWIDLQNAITNLLSEIDDLNDKNSDLQSSNEDLQATIERYENHFCEDSCILRQKCQEIVEDDYKFNYKTYNNLEKVKFTLERALEDI